MTSVLAAAFGMAGAGTASAQNNDGWSFTVTPRAQATLFSPHQNEGYETMTTVGATVIAQTPDPRFAVTGDFFSGEASTTYEFVVNTYDYSVERTDMAAHVEYTPAQSTVTFIGGVRAFQMDFEEEALTADIQSDYDVTFVGLDAGVRIAGRISPDSRHVLSAQWTGFVGQGEYNEVTTGADITNRNVSETALATGAEFAGGYTMFVSDNFAIGARVRAWIYQMYLDDEIDTFGEHVGYGWGPELNASFRF